MNLFIYLVSREGGSAPQTPRPRSNIHHYATSTMRTELLPEALVEINGWVPLGGLPSSSVLRIQHLRSPGSDIFASPAPVAFSCKIIRMTSPGAASESSQVEVKSKSTFDPSIRTGITRAQGVDSGRTKSSQVLKRKAKPREKTEVNLSHFWRRNCTPKSAKIFKSSRSQVEVKSKSSRGESGLRHPFDIFK